MMHNVGKAVLDSILEYSRSDNRGELATLRKGFGKSYKDSPLDVATKVGLHAPQSKSYDYSKISKEINAVHIALTSFAAHQQGKDLKSNLMHEHHASFGKSISQLVDGDETSNSMSAKSMMLYKLSESRSVEEFIQNLSPFIRLFNQHNIKLDYCDFATDVFFFQFTDGRKNVRSKWAIDFANGMKDKTRFAKKKIN